MAENVFAVTQGGLEGPVREDLIDAPGLLEEQVARPAQDLASSVRLLSAGKPLPNVHLRVLDSSGQDLPERWIGEIALQSDCMLSGYYHRPDVTKQAFLDGWYLTGDLGYLADGELYITGRKKDLIIVGGKNVYPQDIERLVNEVEGVHPGRVVAFGVFNEDSGTEDVVVVAEAEFEPQGEPQATAALANEIRRRVTTGSDVALRYVQIVPRNWLIKTSSGKIARGANKERYLTSIQDKKA
jgi:acyl-CoA synthetase (AMP-forming)/AMP-acid ligase II